MGPERWPEVEALFHQALELAAADRGAFLERACCGDAELRQEVESLLEQEPGIEGFLEAPALEAAARLLEEERPDRLAGNCVGPYQLRSVLGQGGYGEVYLARDTRDGRDVALKILSRAFVEETERKQRFEREARMASSLDHPNIRRILEIGQAGGLHFIAAEYVDGQTLLERMAEAGLEPCEAVDVGIQVADALCAAHAAGILHRDINLANVLLRRDGHVKVLDFGIAKRIGRPSAVQAAMPGESSNPSLSTAPGMIVGTVGSMSPEQVRGQPLDGGTDIFSLGVLLYELLCGYRPFEGASAAQVMAAILFDEPPPLRQRRPEIPEELERLVARATRKSRGERHRDAAELARDLRQIRQRL